MDTPVYGEITFSKTGDILTDYDKDSQSFIYDNDQIAGAVYGLYADENIKKDDGTFVWKKDELIDQKTTTKEKEIYFTRKDMDGKETTNFYLGKYYIKEIKSPTGYIKDQEKHEVELTWDTTAGSINDIRDDDKVPDKEDSFGNEDNNVSTGIYVLEKGEKLNQKIKDAESVTFTWKSAPEGAVTTDVSQNKDGTYCALERWWRLLYLKSKSRTGHLHECNII